MTAGKCVKRERVYILNSVSTEDMTARKREKCIEYHINVC